MDKWTLHHFRSLLVKRLNETRPLVLKAWSRISRLFARHTFSGAPSQSYCIWTSGAEPRSLSKFLIAIVTMLTRGTLHRMLRLQSALRARNQRVVRGHAGCFSPFITKWRFKNSPRLLNAFFLISWGCGAQGSLSSPAWFWWVMGTSGLSLPSAPASLGGESLWVSTSYNPSNTFAYWSSTRLN